MAPHAKFLIPFIAALLGLLAWLTWPGWIGGVAFVGLFFLGSVVGTLVFKRFATPEHVRADLEARKYND